MKKAQWSPINSEPPGAGLNSAAKPQRPGLARLPINFSNGTPVRTKEQYHEPPKHSYERPRVVTNLTVSGDPTAAEAVSRASKPRDAGPANDVNTMHTGPSPPITAILHNEPTSELQKRHEMEPNGRHPASVPSSRNGSQTPKADRETGVSTITKRIRPQDPASIQNLRDAYRAFNLPSPARVLPVSEKPSNAIKASEPIQGSVRPVSEKPSNAIKASEPKQGSVRPVSEKPPNAIKASDPKQGSIKGTPGQRNTPAGSTKGSTNEHSVEPPQGHPMAVTDSQPIQIDEQSSSSSDDDGWNLPTGAGPKVEEAIEEVESASIDEPGHATTATSLPDDHPVEWLAEARDVFQKSLPPFVTKQKLGVRRMVELPLVEGQKEAGKAEVVYRFWDAFHTFASIDVNGQRFIVKVFRGGATPYRPWLGPQTGFPKTALAYAKQGIRGSKKWAATQGKRHSLPKGWALQEEEEEDDDYSPDGRRKSASGRRRRHPNYDLNNDEEELNEDPYQGKSYEMAEQLHSDRSSIDGDRAAPDSTGDQQLDSNMSNSRPPSKLINALKKSLRLPKEQDVFQQNKQIKRRSVGGQGANTDSGGNKHEKHKVDFSSDSERSVHHKRAKVIKASPRKSFSTNRTDPGKVSQMSKHEPPNSDTHTLSAYKQTHTTLRIALIPYPLQSVIHRLRSCMTMATFFSTVIGISGYKGDKDRIFGITATFDCKSDDDADKSMVIREEWQDSFDVFLETVDGAESWTEEGGKCGVNIRLLLIDG